MKNFLIATCTVFFLANTTNSSAFKSATHEYITKHAITKLRSTCDEFNEYLSSEGEAILLEYSQKPDFDENYGAYKCHFYSMITEKNFAGGDDSAMAKFTTHYYAAITAAKENNDKKALQELGRALHFLEDLSTPVHSNNLSISDAGKNLHSHIGFENRCEEIQEEVKADFNNTDELFYLINNVSRIGDNVADITSQNFNALKEKIVPVDKVIKNSISLAQRAVTGVIYKFFKTI